MRGADQLGTLGSGNHFLEVQRVAKIIDPQAAEVFGLRQDQVTVLIHSGSRGFGHQVCSDYVRTMDAVQARYRITLPDRQLACAPLSSPEGRRYLAAMACAANFAWGNRAVLAHRVRESIAAILGPNVAEGTRQVYDVAHNVAKLETHHGRTLCVHRKGATRAFPRRLTRDSERVPRGWPTGVHPRLDGHQQLRARRSEAERWSARSGPPVTGREGG